MSDSVATTASVGIVTPRKATADDLPALSQTLAAAFHDDPVFTWWIPDGDRRREILPGFFRVVAESNLPGGEVYTEKDLVGGAVWSPPDAEEDEDLAPALAEASREYAETLFEVFVLMEAKHPTEPHHYLFMLGTRPERQSQGIGSALMGPVLELCDGDRLPAYLEATCERNVQLYLRHGFEVTGRIPLRDGPSLVCMWREPR